MRQAMLTAVAAAAVTGLVPCAASAAPVPEMATVISSTPVSAQVPVPRQQCVQGEQYVQQAPSGVGAVIGAIAGGVLGNSVGGGFGRAAATGLGVVAGSVVGNQVEANGNPVSAVPVQRCQTVTTYENRVVGYDVTYEYAGQRYSTRMARDPGRQFAVDVRPAGNSAAYPTSQSLPAPVYADPGQPAYYEPLPQPVPVYGSPYYYGPAPVVVGAPVIGVGFGYYGGYRGRRWH